MVYLNHAAISPMSFRVREAVAKYLERRALKGIEPYPWAQKMALETKQLLGQLLHCPAEDIAFVLNTSEGLNVLANGIDWKPGDRILLNRLEFPSNLYPFLNLQRHGVIIDFVEPVDWKITPEMIEAKLTPDTRVLSISFVQFLTGQRADLKAIGDLCLKHKLLFAVDVIQGIPHSHINMQEAKIDFLSSGSHKWLIAPEGTGFIAVSEHARSLIHQSTLGWTSVTDPFTFDNLDPERLRPDSGRYENGTLNFAGISGLKAALQFAFEFGIEEMQKQTLDLTEYFIDRLQSRGVHVLTPTPRSERAGIVTFEMENATEIHERLTKQSIIISNRAGKLRAAPHFYNTEDEMRRLFVALFD
jgi:selenocysteine lyase/cysteine desulfurase